MDSARLMRRAGWARRLIVVLAAGTAAVPVCGQETADGRVAGAVHAILFHSPTCPHCRTVIAEHLLPMQDRLGDRLVLLGLNTSTAHGQRLFRAAMEHYSIPPRDRAVPFMIVADEIMIGSLEIPARLPSLVEAGLASGGIDLPDFPELITFLAQNQALQRIEPGPRYVYRDPSRPGPPPDAPPTQRDTVPPTSGGVETPTAERARVGAAPVTVADSVGETISGEPTRPAVDAGRPIAADSVPRSEVRVTGVDSSALPETPSPSSAVPAVPLELSADTASAPTTMWGRFSRDPLGNTLAVAVLATMLFVLCLPGNLANSRRKARFEWPEWATPALGLAGLGVALYLGYVEATGRPAVCGPVGDCNTVQQSPYATLFGLVSIGLLGAAAYVAILVLWAVRRFLGGQARRLAALALWVVTLVGTIFSAYLTFLEPFVIGATCMWCLTSAGLMTALLMASVDPAARACSLAER